MILPDVNVLLHAAHRDFEQHGAYAEWLTTVLAGPEEVGLAALTLSHGARLATADRGFGRFPGLQHFDPLG